VKRNLVVEHVVGDAAGRPAGPLGRVAARPARRAGRAAVPFASGLAGTFAAAVLGTTLVGCSALSPATIATPYAAADGVDGSLTNAADGSRVDLRNMLIVAGAEGGAGQLIGTLTNSGDQPVQVQVGLTPPDPNTQPEEKTITVPAAGAVQLGTPEVAVVLSGVPAAGRMVGLTVRTQGGGVDDLTVPVMAPQGFYATLTPPAVTPTPTPTTP
jgi:hypothetical protein